MRLNQGRLELGNEPVLPHDELGAPLVLALALVEHERDFFEIADRLRERRARVVVPDRGARRQSAEEHAVTGDTLDRQEQIRLERDLRVRGVRSTALRGKKAVSIQKTSPAATGSPHLEPTLNPLLLARRQRRLDSGSRIIRIRIRGETADRGRDRTGQER